MKKIAIMQPYFFPYIGYWQLINSVDEFVVYDNIKYTKKGWINRNRFLQNGKDELFSIQIKSDSDYLDVVNRKISENFDRDKLVKQLSSAYSKAPFFKDNFPVIKEIILFDEQNLFKYIHNSVEKICEYLEIKTKIIISSSIDIDHKNLKSQDKVIAICKALGAEQYINPIGGTELYEKDVFKQHGIELSFLKANELVYKQLGNEFVPWLSIVDVLMFNSREDVKKYLNNYTLS
jgi:hypothetical protein